jgi:hypothetical protein
MEDDVDFAQLGGQNIFPKSKNDTISQNVIETITVFKMVLGRKL